MSMEVIDPTRLRDSLQCLRLYYYRHERHLIPVKPRLPLSFGRGVHATLAEHYRGKSAGVALAAFEEIWETDVLQWSHGLEEDDPKRNPVRWAEVFVLYRQRYRVEPFTVKFVETPFFLPLTNDLALGGILDLVVNYLGQDTVVDHKTTAKMDQTYFASFNPNHQFTAYLIAATELLEKPVTTLWVNNILSHAKESNPEKLFQRVPTTRSKQQLDAAKQEFIDWWNIVRSCRRSGSWPRNDDRCQRWGGGCDYHSICTDIQADYRKVKVSSTMFREEQWDPIAELRERGLNL